MSATAGMRAADTLGSAQRRIQIEVRNFGPVAKGLVDLRPLTVFVGPSNTGKTYLSILVYALHRSLGGFQRLPASHASLNFPYDLIGYSRPGQGLQSDNPVLKQTVSDLIKNTQQPSIRYSDLPASVRSNMQAVLQDPELLGSDLELELKRCLDCGTNSDFIRLPSEQHELSIALRVAEADRCLWHFSMKMTGDRTTVAGDIEDLELTHAEAASADLKLAQLRHKLSQTPRLISGNDILDLAHDGEKDNGTMHYLPAARSGIMQSHRVIASSLIARSTRAGLERPPELPTFSGVVADFMQRIILYRSEDPTGNDALRELANALEQETLAGHIGTREIHGGYTDFAYRPLGTVADIPLTRASSMVTELAPVVLFIHSLVRVGDTLIVEEPEAHLHPAAQTRMAATLARLVRAGVRVLITTHSDWLLKEIGNLMREGALAEQTGEPMSGSSLSSTLHPSEVGIWLFRQGETDQGSTVEEIPFDRSEGVEPAEYDDVAEELYNRAADLQNKLESGRDA